MLSPVTGLASMVGNEARDVADAVAMRDQTAGCGFGEYHVVEHCGR